MKTEARSYFWCCFGQLNPDINEADLRRTPNNSMTKEELHTAVNEAIHASTPPSQSVLKLGGALVDEIIEFVQRVSRFKLSVLAFKV